MVRIADGVAGLALVLLAALVADFLADWTIGFSRGQRLALLIAFVLLGLWALRRFVWPPLLAMESIIDLALQVERRQGIDSDLVAALQFESAEARSWGSAQLETATVEQVAEASPRWKLDPGPTNVRLNRRLGVLAVAAVAIGLASASYPEFASAFLNRFLLGTAHYPTRTTIIRVVINGLEAVGPEATRAARQIPFGSALKIEVESAGESPDAGELRLVAATGGGATSIPLVAAERTPADDGLPAVQREQSGASHGQGTASGFYRAEIARLTENVSFQVFVGDAWTEPALLTVISPPVVSLELEQTPPPYATSAKAARRAAGSRQLSVIEGSAVSVTVRCANKALAKAELVIGSERFALAAQDAEKRVWKLPGNTPLARVAEPVAFDVEIVDADDMTTEQPLHGHIYIEADRPPRVAAAIVTERVLPGAHPGIAWGAADDYGLTEIRLSLQITRSGGAVEQQTQAVRTVPAGEQPVPVLRGKYVLDLKPFKLSKGDEVRVTLEAVDFRGDQPGTAARSDPLLFTVTDESGILAGLIEADEKSARQLDQIITRQLGIGEGR
jgi:hypothetical protein